MKQSARFTIADLDRKVKAGTIVSYQVVKGNAKSKLPAIEPKGLAYIKELLTKSGIAFEVEYVFASPRKFRFDIAIVDHMLGIEYEGIFSPKSRHTNKMGYSKDAEKYNLAQSLGWRVFRYTASNYKNFEQDIKVITK